MAIHRALGLAAALVAAVALGADKARFVLGNIRNHIDGVKGWDHIEAIELVVHGPALEGFTAGKIDREVKRRLAEVQGEGMVFGACGNTMASFNELVEQGYVYIRP